MATDDRQRWTTPQRELTGLQTTACVLVAALGLWFGVYATIKTDNELGTAASFLIGALFAIFALLGQVPRIGAGGYGIDPRVAEEIHDDGRVEGAAEVTVKVVEAGEKATEPREVVEAARSASEGVAAATNVRLSNRRYRGPFGDPAFIDSRTGWTSSDPLAVAEYVSLSSQEQRRKAQEQRESQQDGEDG